MSLDLLFCASTLPKDHQRAIATNWAFKIKRKTHGSIEKYKARLVAKVFKHHFGIVYA